MSLVADTLFTLPTPAPPPPPPPPRDPFDIPLEYSTRVLGLDPALSTGWCMLDFSESVGAVHVGVLDVQSVEGTGARCNRLQELLLPLLTPPPIVVYESFIGHGRKGDDVSFMLRGAILMLLDKHGITPIEVRPQTWKAAVYSREASKEQVKTALEQRMRAAFPLHLYIGDTFLKFRDDASEACGIAWWAAHQRGVDFGELQVDAPGLPKPRIGKPLPDAVFEPKAKRPKALPPATYKDGVDVWRSTLPGKSGRGAFATRAFAKNSIVTEYAGERVSRNEAFACKIQTHILGLDGVHIDGLREPERGQGVGSFCNNPKIRGAMSCLSPCPEL